MRDNDLIVAVRETLLAGFSHFETGLKTVPAILQNFQPTMQGAKSSPVVYLTKITSAKRGSLRKDQVFDQDLGYFKTIDVQYLETHFQVMASAQVNLSDPTADTAGDIAEVVKIMLLGDFARVKLLEKGAQVLRASETREHKILNEQNQFEVFPNFDIVFSHKRLITGNAPPAVVEGAFHRANGDAAE